MVFLIRMAHRKQQRYELKESSIIGTGGFSTVYRALDRHTRRFVAIKVMGREHTVISEQEERVGYAILHPHLVRLLDSFRTRKHHYLVYELLEGRDLFDRIIDHGPLREEAAQRATRALVSAVHHLHARNVIHRDIKPDNCLFASPQSAADDFVLADLGLSAFVGPAPLDIVQGHAGSPGYCSPELLIEGASGRPADMWSLGITVYSMLTARTPFSADDPIELHKECRRGFIVYPDCFWSDVSAEATDFVRSCLRRDPLKRMTAAEALRHPWLS